MDLRIEIGFEQLLYLVLQLPPNQKKKLVEVLTKPVEKVEKKGQLTDLQKLLLTGPVWSDEQIEMVLTTKKQLNELGQISTH